MVESSTTFTEELCDTLKIMEDRSSKSNACKRGKKRKGEEQVNREEEEEDEDFEQPSTSRQRRESDTTDTESDVNEKEDFPTEGLLKELHFLNAR